MKLMNCCVLASVSLSLGYLFGKKCFVESEPSRFWLNFSLLASLLKTNSHHIWQVTLCSLWYETHDCTRTHTQTPIWRYWLVPVCVWGRLELLSQCVSISALAWSVCEGWGVFVTVISCYRWLLRCPRGSWWLNDVSLTSMITGWRARANQTKWRILKVWVSCESRQSRWKRDKQRLWCVANFLNLLSIRDCWKLVCWVKHHLGLFLRRVSFLKHVETQ